MTADTSLASLQAAAALRGIEVRRSVSGFVVLTHGEMLVIDAPDMDSLIALLARMGVKA